MAYILELQNDKLEKELALTRTDSYSLQKQQVEDRLRQSAKAKILDETIGTAAAENNAKVELSIAASARARQAGFQTSGGMSNQERDFHQNWAAIDSH